MPNKILLVDGMALLFRHFYATSLHKQFMYNSQGEPTNGIQGFVRHIFRQYMKYAYTCSCMLGYGTINF